MSSLRTRQPASSHNVLGLVRQKALDITVKSVVAQSCDLGPRSSLLSAMSHAGFYTYYSAN